MNGISRFSGSNTSDAGTSRVRVGVYGASGTTGTELIRLLLGHAHCAVAFATSREFSGRSLRDVDISAPDVLLVDPTDVDPSQVDVVFVCLPHGAAGECVARCAEACVRVIDLSGDYRLRNLTDHIEIYGSRRDQGLVSETVYGLSETARREVQAARVISNPGCYPTCVGLALWPLAKSNLLRETIVVNAQSGVSGAGRLPTHDTHFCSVVDDIRPYKLGRQHRHVAEMEQYLSWWCEGKPPELIFNPHVVPVERGMLATIVVNLPDIDHAVIRDLYGEAYEGEAFVNLLPEGEAARIRGVVRTNQAFLGIHPVADSKQLVITCAIDNLLKGAAGQAVQNMNLMFGFAEEEGFIVTNGTALERRAPVREVLACK